MLDIFDWFDDDNFDNNSYEDIEDLEELEGVDEEEDMGILNKTPFKKTMALEKMPEDWMKFPVEAYTKDNTKVLVMGTNLYGKGFIYRVIADDPFSCHISSDLYLVHEISQDEDTLKRSGYDYTKIHLNKELDGSGRLIAITSEGKAVYLIGKDMEVPSDKECIYIYPLSL